MKHLMHATLLSSVSMLASLSMMAGTAVAQDVANYPSGPVNIIVTAPAGGPTDTGTRLLAEAVESHFGQPWVVLNRPGAGGLVGFQALATAAPDCNTAGYMLMPHFPAQSLSGVTDLTMDDYVTISLLVDDPNVVAVPADSPYETLEDLVQATLDNPGEISWGDNGYLGDDYLVIAAMMAETGMEPNIITFDGATEVNAAILGGHVDAKVGNVGDTRNQHNDGQMRILAVTSEERNPSLPDIPTLRELGFDVAASAARGLAFPAGTPVECAEIMAEAIAAASQEQSYIDAMDQQGLPIRVISGADYDTFIEQRFEFVRGVLEFLGEI